MDNIESVVINWRSACYHQHKQGSLWSCSDCEFYARCEKATDMIEAFIEFAKKLDNARGEYAEM